MTHTADRGPGQASPEHAGHDQLLIARYAAGDLGASEAKAASELVAACVDCSALADDLRVLATAMSAPPALPRRRDFRLNHARAAELRRPSLLERLRAWHVPELAWVQPLAGAVAVVGLVMALATSGIAIPGPGGAASRSGTPLTAVGPGATPAAAGAAALPSAAPAAPALGAVPAPSAGPITPSVPPPAVAAAPASPATAPRSDQSAASAPAASAGRSAAATSARDLTGTGPGVPVWPLWLAVAVVGGAAFVVLRRARRPGV